MPNNSTRVSGQVKRIFVDTHDVTTYAKFTLVGNNTVFSASTTDHDVRDRLQLTAPGDNVGFEYEAVGWLLKVNNFIEFINNTLALDLGNTESCAS
jgi:hypothetical protein